MHSTALLAISWDPEIRGILVVAIMFTVLCGGVYLLLGTNLGARLGLMIALAGLFGWMALLGGMWSVYGLGLKGKSPTWQPKEVIVGDLSTAENSVARGVGPHTGWKELPADDPGYGQANAASDDILLNKSKIFSATTQYKTLAVYDNGGKKWPRIGPYEMNIKFPWHIKSIDFEQLAFFHDPHYAMVEVQPVLAANTEPGKAPPTALPDGNKPKTFVLMERDLGYTRLPDFAIMIGSGLIFGVLVYKLHERDKLSMRRTARLPALPKGSV